MQIDRIQTTQPNFGTKVKADSAVLNAFSRHSGLKKQFAKFVEKLENNGRNDTLVITRGRGDCDHYYNALVYETKPAAGENGSDLYNGQVALSKMCWLHKHLKSVQWDEIKIVKYGTNKYNECGGGILFDDEENNRNMWQDVAYTPEILLSVLSDLLA